MVDTVPAPGPLAGVRVIELAGIGPAPFAAMMLADLGADVVRVDRVSGPQASFGTPEADLLGRGRRSIGVDLKHPDAAGLMLDLVTRADVLLEGFRPGVAERLGIGPEACLAANPALVYGRMTGWGQDGPYAPYAGHDIDYLALTGALYGIGRADSPPVPPLNLVGDFGGGGMLLALGVVCALYDVRGGGAGQVIDAAIVDGVALLTTAVHGLRRSGLWRDRRAANLLDGAVPFYDTYQCADGQFLAVGALESQFYAELVARTGFQAPSDLDSPEARFDPANWPALRQAWAELFATRPRDEWAALLEHTDACAVPVLDWAEAAHHPHLAARATFVDYAGVSQPAPAPRFSRTPGSIRRPPPNPGEHTDEVLRELGLEPERIEHLRAAGTIA